MFEIILAMSWQEIAMIILSTIGACSIIGALFGKNKLANLRLGIICILAVIAINNYSTIENWAIQSYRYAIYNTDIGHYMDFIENLGK
jgi:uncharacterized membrane protein